MKRLLLNSAIVCALSCLGYGTAHAQIDLGEIELGKAYEIGNFQVYVGTITAPSTGILYQYGGSPATIDGEEMEYEGYCDNGQLWSYSVTEGVTYALTINFSTPGNDGTITWNMQGDQAFEIREIDPEAGSMISCNVNGLGDILIVMNEPWTYSKAYIQCGDQTSPTTTCMESQTTQCVRIGEWMKTWYESGVLDINGGTPFELVVEGAQNVTGTLYNEDGIITISYISAPKPIDLVSTNIVDGSDFLSYYPAGDPAGIYTLTFDGELNAEKTPVLAIGSGNIEAEDAYYYTEINGVVNGKSITFDVTGVDRKADFAKYKVPNGSDVSLKVLGVYDVYGNLAAGGSSTQVGTYSYSLIYKVVNEIVIDYEFSPASGSSLNDYETLNIWMNNADCITWFEGINFEYADGTHDLIPYDELENVSTFANELEYNVVIPSRARTEKVIVSVLNITTTDGYEKEISATYNLTDGISSVDMLDDSNKGYKVYRIDGTHVLTTNVKSALSSLAPGLYIINSQKVMIK